MRQEARWSWIWGAFTLAFGTVFVVLESIALTRRTVPTYSHTLARWFGCQPPARRRPLTIGAYVAASGWLVLHLWSYQDRDLDLGRSFLPAGAATAPDLARR